MAISPLCSAFLLAVKLGSTLRCHYKTFIPSNSCSPCMVHVTMKGLYDHSSENAFELSSPSQILSFVLIIKDTFQSSYQEKSKIPTGIIVSIMCNVLPCEFSGYLGCLVFLKYKCLYRKGPVSVTTIVCGTSSLLF